MNKIKIGLLGLGTVGTGVVRLVESHKEDLFNQTGAEVEIERILVKDLSKERAVSMDSRLLTVDPYNILHNPEIDVVIEVMGGIHPAKSYLFEALNHKKHVVTANKDLMSLYGAELLQTAVNNGCDLLYEASVAGGIPILKAVTDGFSSDRIKKIMGIVNGTTNYILTKMSQEEVSFENALKEAQRLGYAEEDPASDVEGLDAARKMVILSTLGFHLPVKLEDVECQGITSVSVEDIKYGQRLGYTLKLLGIAKEDNGRIEVSVHPTMIKNSHPLAMVNGVNNAVYVYGEAVGETMFYGPGAGELPTATAVLSDLVSAVKNMKLGVNGRGIETPYKEKKLKGQNEIFSKYFIRLIVKDQSGVLAQIAQILANEEVSLEQIIQVPYQIGKDKAELIIITHQSSKANLKNVLRELEKSKFIAEIKSCYHVEGE